jgi:hypothetical protein
MQVRDRGIPVIGKVGQDVGFRLVHVERRHPLEGERDLVGGAMDRGDQLERHVPMLGLDVGVPGRGPLALRPRIIGQR